MATKPKKESNWQITVRGIFLPGLFLALVFAAGLAVWRSPVETNFAPKLAGVDETEKSEIDRTLQIISNAMNNIKDEPAASVISAQQQANFTRVIYKGSQEVRLTPTEYQRVGEDIIKVSTNFTYTLFTDPVQLQDGRSYFSFQYQNNRWILVESDFPSAIR